MKTVDEALVRELTARHEGTKLDFKLKQYDWASGGNAELAKDLMAMANALQPQSMPAHILIGVQEDAVTKTGQVIGVPASYHLDDASMHQKVASKLNRTPDFSYMPVSVGTLSIGVFQVRPSRRPIYPVVNDGSSLKKGVARYRDGSTTCDATPEQIAEWALEDKLLVTTTLRPYIGFGKDMALTVQETPDGKIALATEFVLFRFLLRNSGPTGARWRVGSFNFDGKPDAVNNSGIIQPNGEAEYSHQVTVPATPVQQLKGTGRIRIEYGSLLDLSASTPFFVEREFKLAERGRVSYTFEDGN